MATQISLSFPIIVGMHLMEAYQNLCYQMVQAKTALIAFAPKSTTNNKTGINNDSLTEGFIFKGNNFLQDDFYIDLSLRFRRLKKSWRLFSQLGGFCCISYVGLSLTDYILFIQNRSDMEANIWNADDAISICDFMGLLLLTSAGNFLENNFTKNREILKNAKQEIIGNSMECFHNAVVHHFRIADWMISWKWEFSAANVFRMNYSILPTILITIMTYFFVLFQLRQDDDGRKISPENCAFLFSLRSNLSFQAPL
ncbi:unnamed protein product [Allacma fusca]|uniref:Uncharacterized protein n=1 Tax=Allacma fusca TaxID=39272 RepID=A0A8J2KW21_9HEXA|nr:unnamed protein product [Allacma fusca]